MQQLLLCALHAFRSRSCCPRRWQSHSSLHCLLWALSAAAGPSCSLWLLALALALFHFLIFYRHLLIGGSDLDLSDHVFLSQSLAMVLARPAGLLLLKAAEHVRSTSPFPHLLETTAQRFSVSWALPRACPLSSPDSVTGLITSPVALVHSLGSLRAPAQSPLNVEKVELSVHVCSLSERRWLCVCMCERRAGRGQKSHCCQHLCQIGFPNWFSFHLVFCPCSYYPFFLLELVLLLFAFQSSAGYHGEPFCLT